ncbi:MAG TPA: hypothetical protein DCY94_01585 [Firmicutes bacterium]|nr:hypothetical protein [Bacillota bacterium]
MNGNYLIPANSKKSEMILGMFTPVDLILFLCGVGLTFILIMAVHTNSFVGIILLLLPALIASFLVFPVPNYHNVLQLIINIYTFYFVRQRIYKWKGWCYKDGGSNK